MEKSVGVELLWALAGTHCQEDHIMIGIAYMWNWLEDVLQPMR
jgi:hypothetical protein